MINKSKSEKRVDHRLSFGSMNFFSSCSNFVADADGWVKFCDFPLENKESLALFKDCNSPDLDNWDLRVLVFISAAFSKNDGLLKSDDDSFLYSKELIVNFKMSEICKFWGVEKSDTFFKEKIKDSLRKLVKCPFKLEGSAGEHYNTVISDLSILRKKYDKDSVRVVCRINEWAILVCSRSLLPVVRGFYDSSTFCQNWRRILWYPRS